MKNLASTIQWVKRILLPGTGGSIAKSVVGGTTKASFYVKSLKFLGELAVWTGASYAVESIISSGDSDSDVQDIYGVPLMALIPSSVLTAITDGVGNPDSFSSLFLASGITVMSQNPGSVYGPVLLAASDYISKAPNPSYTLYSTSRVVEIFEDFGDKIDASNIKLTDDSGREVLSKSVLADTASALINDNTPMDLQRKFDFMAFLFDNVSESLIPSLSSVSPSAEDFMNRYRRSES